MKTRGPKSTVQKPVNKASPTTSFQRTIKKALAINPQPTPMKCFFSDILVDRLFPSPSCLFRGPEHTGGWKTHPLPAALTQTRIRCQGSRAVMFFFWKLPIFPQGAFDTFIRGEKLCKYIYCKNKHIDKFGYCLLNPDMGRELRCTEAGRAEVVLGDGGTQEKK